MMGGSFFSILSAILFLGEVAVGGFWDGDGTQEGIRLPSSAFALPGDATYDYIIVGGGTAGLAMAARLAPTASVAVVEAGGIYQVDNNNQSVVPYYAFSMPTIDQTEEYPKNPLIDPDITTVPLSGVAGRRIHYPQGKTLGGASAVNSMAYHRATKGTHAQWAEVVGDESYTWDNILPYLKKSATFSAPDRSKLNDPTVELGFDESVFGDGPVQVGFSNYFDETPLALSAALAEEGMELSATGLLSGELTGQGSWAASTISRDMKRSSAATSYLDQALRETQLMVYHRTKAMKILFDGTTATGVSVSTLGLEYALSATKEVIVSAGAFFSPQLLMVSGVGPQETLAQLGIDLVSDSPLVGQNLQDQVHFNVLHGMKTSTAAAEIAADPDAALQAYLEDRTGPYTYNGGFLGFEKLPNATREGLSEATRNYLDATLPGDGPEVEYIVSGFPAGDNSTTGLVLAMPQRPASRGNVTLAGPSMDDAPVVDTGWLTDPVDEEMAVALIRRAREIFDATAIASVRVGAEISPGEGVQSDEDLLAYARESAETIYHACCTCGMGRDEENGVVDSNGKVFGVDGLRVVDASVLPFILPGHPQANVYMLAEKIADVILKGEQQ